MFLFDIPRSAFRIVVAMPKFDEEQLALAKVYSAAMLALAQETGAAQTLAEELVQIGKLLDREKGLES